MSTDNQNNPNDMSHRRRGSVTQQALAGLFRSNSTSVGNGNLQATEANRRRLSISTTGIGLAGTSPTNPGVFSNGFRRGSLSTSSDSIDESAIDEDDSSRTAPTTPFVRRMSFGNPAMRGARNGGGGSPGSNGNHPSAPSNAPSHIKPPANAARRSSVNPRGGAPTGASPVRDTKKTPPPPRLPLLSSLLLCRRRQHRCRHPSVAPAPPHRQASNWLKDLLLTRFFPAQTKASTGLSNLGPELRAPFKGRGSPSPLAPPCRPRRPEAALPTTIAPNRSRTCPPRLPRLLSLRLLSLSARSPITSKSAS